MPRVLVPIATGFEEIEAVSIIDVLRRAGIDVIMGALDETLAVQGAHGITMLCDGLVGEIGVDEIDMIVLPGGWGATKTLAHDVNVQNLLKAMDNMGKNIGAICAAPYALEAAGVLKEGYTCYPSIENKITTGGFRGDENAVVESGNIITSRGPGSAICFALTLVKRLTDRATYEALKTDLLAECCDR
ncbi:MAG: DJ-1/PfpI family protein [Sulfuricurvum sp.]|uniref:DJ-1 family glyoxalase III n=1 Tax=Sulfuricurvum sp. TaxID=2025608 RepID=UPI0026151AF2|nr:DJ-1 family glyoxalase III [Sulfuricurvum sp.]MDD2828782.1 DJ-1/PfpI family protein [Sulfuricurvum sp.]MDD4948759.1 DJ-1/PfpI family protein [Sulfuricurvum sp.]